MPFNQLNLINNYCMKPRSFDGLGLLFLLCVIFTILKGD